MRRLMWALLLVLAGAIGLSGCGSSAEVSTQAGPTAQAAPKSGATLDPAEFAAAIKREGTMLIDVRTPAEFAEGHLPGAQNIDVEAAGFLDAIAKLPTDGTYAIYCRSGNRSGVAMSAMRSRGFTEVFHLGGGITAWTDAGGDVTN